MRRLAFFVAALLPPVLLISMLAGAQLAGAQPVEGTWVPAGFEPGPTVRVEGDALFWTVDKQAWCLVRRMELQWKGTRAVTTASAEPTWTIDLAEARDTAYVTHEGKTRMYHRVFASKIDDCRIEEELPR